MRNRYWLLGSALLVMIGSTTLAIAQERAGATHASSSASTTPPAASSVHGGASSAPSDGAWRIEGEKRFRQNCGRCHMAPQKFPPREMAMILRHMRVRAMLTDEDTRLILRYMTQ
jgi:cytochrome c5